MTPDQLRKWARVGAKQEIRQILSHFPDLLGELKHDQAAERAAHARSFKQTKRRNGKTSK